MLFKVIMYYALAKGAWNGLRGRMPPNWRMREMDRILKAFYIEPIREQLNKPMPPWILDFDEIQVEAGSAL